MAHEGSMQKFIGLAVLAAFSFSIGGYFMKLSAGLTQLRPTLLVFAFFAVGACCQTVAMRGEQMAITYIVVLGLEAISALVLSIFLLNEGISLPKLIGVGLVLLGITILQLGKG
jgi:multidrug transporter EmrE-like cation transporter